MDTEPASGSPGCCQTPMPTTLTFELVPPFSNTPVNYTLTYIGVAQYSVNTWQFREPTPVTGDNVFQIDFFCVSSSGPYSTFVAIVMFNDSGRNTTAIYFPPDVVYCCNPISPGIPFWFYSRSDFLVSGASSGGVTSGVESRRYGNPPFGAYYPGWQAQVYYECTATSGDVEHADYWPAIDTGRILDGIPLWATADCRPDPAPPSGDINHPFDPVPNSGLNRAIYRMASFTNRRLDGIPLMAAEIDPCCDGGFAIGGPNSGGGGGGGGGTGPNVATCGCGSVYGTPRTIYAVGSSGSTPGVYPMTYQGQFPGGFPSEICDVWLGNFVVGSVTYGILYRICASGFACAPNVLITNQAGDTIICYPRVNNYQCPPLFIEVASYWPGTCEPIIGAFTFTIVDTPP
jgi:hypothetical protein